MGSPGGVCGVGALSCFRVPELGGRRGTDSLSLRQEGSKSPIILLRHPEQSPAAVPPPRTRSPLSSGCC